MPITANTSAPTSLNAYALYSLAEFIRSTGISYTRIQQATRAGVPLPSIKVGRRLYIEGSEGISYIKQLAVLQAAVKGGTG